MKIDWFGLWLAVANFTTMGFIFILILIMFDPRSGAGTILWMGGVAVGVSVIVILAVERARLRHETRKYLSRIS